MGHSTAMIYMVTAVVVALAMAMAQALLTNGMRIELVCLEK